MNFEFNMTLFETLSLTLSGVTSIALILAVWQIKINRKQLYLATITKCVQDFPQVVLSLQLRTFLDKPPLRALSQQI